MEEIIKRSWVKITRPPRYLFFYNPVSDVRQWTTPEFHTFKIPHILHVSFRKKVPGTVWEFVMLNNNNFFFLHTERFFSTWSVPQEVKHIYEKEYIPIQKSTPRLLPMLPIPIPPINMEIEDDDGEEEDGESDSDEFEIIDTSTGQIIEDDDEESTMVGAKRKLEEVEVVVEVEEVEQEKPKKKRKITVVDRFAEMLEEGVAAGKITAEMTYAKFFKKFLRDIRFRKLTDNKKRKEMFSKKIDEIKGV